MDVNYMSRFGGVVKYPLWMQVANRQALMTQCEHAQFTVDLTAREGRFCVHAHITDRGGAMRITAEAKAETRQRIIEAASDLFTTEGWENTTTRGIAAEAGIATGTLFNYFESKESIVAAMMSEALSDAQ